MRERVLGNVDSVMGFSLLMLHNVHNMCLDRLFSTYNALVKPAQDSASACIHPSVWDWKSFLAGNQNSCLSSFSKQVLMMPLLHYIWNYQYRLFLGHLNLPSPLIICSSVQTFLVHCVEGLILFYSFAYHPLDIIYLTLTNYNSISIQLESDIVWDFWLYLIKQRS